MRKTHAWCLIVTGAMLLVAALLLIFYNMRQDEGSGKESALILSDLRQQIAQQHTEPATTEPDLMQYIPTNDLFSEYATEETQEATEEPTQEEDPVVEIDGSLMEYQLQPGEQLVVDSGNVAAFTPSVKMEIQQVAGLKNKLLGGEGLFNTLLTGPGTVWLQTMPISGIAATLQGMIPSGNG